MKHYLSEWKRHKTRLAGVDPKRGENILKILSVNLLLCLRVGNA